MKLNELLELISQKTGNSVNQSMLADSLGITRQTVSNRIKNESEVTVSETSKFIILGETTEYSGVLMVKLLYHHTITITAKSNRSRPKRFFFFGDFTSSAFCSGAVFVCCSISRCSLYVRQAYCRGFQFRFCQRKP